MAPPSARITVRHARADDAEQVEEVRVDGWRSAYRGLMPDATLDDLQPDLDRRAAQLADPLGTDLVADLDGRIAGWLAHGPARDGDAPPRAREVYACYVDPSVWRGGVGRALMRAALPALEDAPALLWVLKGNERATAFYGAFGFRPDGAERALERLPLSPGPGIIEVRYRRDPEGPL